MSVIDLEERLIDFAVLISDIVEMLPNKGIGKYLSGQIIRSGASSALNYGEAQDAESKADFIHKIKIVLKELRETFVALKIISRKELCDQKDLIEKALKENDELIAIFVTSIKTAKKSAE